MYCRYCGAEVNEEKGYCSSCGARLKEEAETVATVTGETSEKKQLKCWHVFANVGFGLGLGSLIGFWLYSISIFTAIAGLVFSILGSRSEINAGKAKKGIILSGIALGLSTFIWFALIALVFGSYNSMIGDILSMIDM